MGRAPPDSGSRQHSRAAFDPAQLATAIAVFCCGYVITLTVVKVLSRWLELDSTAFDGLGAIYGGVESCAIYFALGIERAVLDRERKWLVCFCVALVICAQAIQTSRLHVASSGLLKSGGLMAIATHTAVAGAVTALFCIYYLPRAIARKRKRDGQYVA